MTRSESISSDTLHELGYKIFLERYALKAVKRATLKEGDTVIVITDSEPERREIGEVVALDLPKVTVHLRDGETVIRDIEYVDKPLETDPVQMMDRVAKGVAAAEKNKTLRREWEKKFRWVPGLLPWPMLIRL